MRETADPDRELAAWADGVLARIDAQQGLDGELLAALGRGPSLREETLARMAEAVRTAALGFGPAGCAAAAGVSERLLLNWQEHNPSFAAAMSGARALARSHGSDGDGDDAPRPPASAALLVLLQAIRTGAQHASAAALAGMPRAALNRLRKERPKVDALVLAARRARPKRADRRGSSTYEHGYRLVRIDDAPSSLQGGSREGQF
ncbi:hypothetical protein I2W78_35575 [Streptomyces spinoverrucosus]|uniref:hypothetical protein n=1 Tax=Streptomyces spinoverrucosus TaxID=284043 RepID=UPI0018C38A7F|nr:hypothetical protein [Streptomyces spinoverrucosus]MBG0857031.1 hypothetical protein [Streptomyces spinoverrucosus]